MKQLLTFLIIFCSGLAQSASVNDINWYTEEYPPWNYTENGELKGFYVDVLLDLWVKVGINKTKQDIRVLPWARGYHYLNTDPNTALFSMARTAEREKLGILWVGPLETGKRTAIFAKKDKHYRFDSIDDVNQEFTKASVGSINKIGALNKGATGQFFLQIGGSPKALHRVNTTDQLFGMLKNDRVSAISYNMMNAFYVMKKLGMNPKNYEVVFYLTPPTTGGYFGFNKDTDPQLIEVLQKALDELRQEGVIDKHYEKYKPNLE
ncbi:transporter substrate-binding domain-containing protein [Vibrio sp. S4M6]|uniref:substrate-binding periplasmic protein n=1 Tax=Vibrio sinus TaxID=2946865 RepID=UPI00202A30B3|nr:transporter substrate-binding domain-containing protein [Vibrio sinus]MCL9783877.1 transporter substrate-binding domain-containing protein [Vibrio sinus]